MQLIDENKFKQNIGQKIRLYRKDTQEKIAENASISVDTLSLTERGQTLISSVTLVKLANSLNVTPNDILNDFMLKDKVIENELNREFKNLSTEEKEFLLSTVKFIKSHKNNVC